MVSNNQETNIVIDHAQKSMFQRFVSAIALLAILIIATAVLGYAFLTYTDKGNEILHKYNADTMKTEKIIAGNFRFLRQFISTHGLPPARMNDILQSDAGMAIRNETVFVSNGDAVVFIEKDAFGHLFRYDVDTDNRVITIRSTGALGIYGVLNIVRSMKY